MRILLMFACASFLAAQTPQPDKPSADKPAVATPPAATPAADTPPPAATPEAAVTGSVDVGYRWRSDVGGSLDAYRSIVNLGSGPKLLGADFTLSDPNHRFFDTIVVRAASWGDDPYSSFHFTARKAGVYDVRADYRNIAYFNFLPSYADPLMARGILLSEQTFDTRRRFANFQIDLRPGHRVIPYFQYDHDSGSGTGVTAFVSDGNEYAAPNKLNDRTNVYRGGVRFELERYHATLEQGGTTYAEDQSVYQTSGINYGNSLTPLFGSRLDLTNLSAVYGVSGSSYFTRGLFTGSPFSWLDLYGQFLFSQPSSTVNYRQIDSGNLYLQSQVLLYNSQQYLLSSAAKLPHTTASFGAEVRPVRRVRILESWLTDRLHNAGSAQSSQVVSGAGFSQQTAAALASSLQSTYNQQQVDVLVDLTPKVTVRGGYRYVWGTGSDTVLPAAGLVSFDLVKLRRNVGLGGFSFHATQKLAITGDLEIGASSGAYFRTSLYNYQKVRGQARYNLSPSVALSADFSLLNNHNPLAGGGSDYRSWQESLSLQWAPGGGKVWDFQGTYTRSSLKSDILFHAPQDFSYQNSFYRDNAHTATALFNFRLPAHAGLAPAITAGGSLFLSSGSRPSRYYQPLASVHVPMGKHWNWFTEWQYYGYGEAFQLYEGFRTNLVTAGVRLTR